MKKEKKAKIDTNPAREENAAATVAESMTETEITVVIEDEAHTIVTIGDHGTAATAQGIAMIEDQVTTTIETAETLGQEIGAATTAVTETETGRSHETGTETEAEAIPVAQTTSAIGAVAKAMKGITIRRYR